MLKTTKNGTTAYHMICTLESLGFTAYGIKSKELKETKIPFIAHTIIKSSYKHYMVVYEVTKKYVVVADPAEKIKKLNIDNFLSIWTGISIEMYPKDIITFEKSKTKIKLFKLDKKIVVIIGIISIVITIFSIVISFFFQFLIDYENLENIILIFTILIFLKIILNYVREKILIKFTSNIERDITKKVFDNIIKLPYCYYHNHTAGEIISKINDLMVFKDVVLKLILTCFIHLPLTVVCFFILFYLNKCLFIISLFILLFYILIVFIYHKKINVTIYKTLERKSRLNSFMTESIYGFESVKGIGIENKIVDLFCKKYNDYIKSKINLSNIVNRQNIFKDVIDSYGTMVILVIGIIMVKKGVFSLSLLITYNILLSCFLEPFKNIISLDYEIKEARNALNRVLSLMEIGFEKSNIVKGNIVVDNLSFSFDDINYVLRNVNIRIKEGNKVLISGDSGSGKSTLLKLIKGYYSDFEGNILIGNKKISALKNVLYVSNKEMLFTGTIDYNLCLKDCFDVDEKIKLCLVDEIINDYSLGKNMLIEEDGFNVSAGQKQRLVLARSLHNFDILLIDEGLNAMDVNLERRILKNIFKRYNDKTIIIVSHRLDNLDLFDQYVKLNKGQVVFSSCKAGKEE